MILSMVNEPTINGFLRKRFSAKEVFKAQVAVDLLPDNDVQAIILSEYMGDTEAILNAVITIRKASPVKIIYIGHDIPEILGKALIGAGVLILAGEFSEEQLVALVEQYYDEETVQRFADPEIAAAAAVNINLPSIIRQPIISITGGSGSGKSAIASALARVVGEHVRTVLVDVSTSPKQHVYFDVKDKYHHKNINKYSLSNTGVENFLIEINKNLFLLPGATDTRGEINMSQASMSNLIDQLRSLFDVIIFDCSSIINDMATHEAVKASREVLMVTVGDILGLEDVKGLLEYMPENVKWLQNKYIGSSINHVYVQLKNKKKPVLSIPYIDYTEVASAIEKGKSHSVLEDAAKEISRDVLKIAPPEEKKKTLLEKIFRRGDRHGQDTTVGS